MIVRKSVSWRPLQKTIYRNCTTSSEYLPTPVYPPILEVTEKAKKLRDDQVVYDKMRALHTVEEKLFTMNLPKYYGWNTVILKEGEVPLNFLPFAQHVTRTKLVKLTEEFLGRGISVEMEECKDVLEKVRPILKEAIAFELSGRTKQEEEDRVSGQVQSDNKGRQMSEQINNIILSVLSSSRPYILGSSVDYDPRVEAFWKVGGFHPSHELYRERSEKKDATDEEKEASVEHWLQFFAKPFIQVRCGHPLSEFKTEFLLSENNEVKQVPTVKHDPGLAYSVNLKRRYGTNLPGFWPGDVNEFGLLSYHGQGFIEGRPPSFGEKEHKESVHSQAILSAFAWLHSQACYQGFSTFHELTYPLTTQQVFTDGRLFSFYLYQLNTVILHGDNIDTNPRENLCAYVPSAPLFKELRGTELTGWNDNVLLNLISLYLNTPKKREGVELKPYLNENESLLAHIKDNERRIWLHNQFRHMYSNRPRHRPGYEIYDWERIYKIKFPMRPIEPRMRPFELDRNPTEERKYYDHVPEYIPRKFRPRKKHWTSWRAKFGKTYYPEIW